MAKATRKKVPGQIIAKRGLLHIRVPDGQGGFLQRSTGLSDTVRNRKEAELLKETLYLQVLNPVDDYSLKRQGEVPLRLYDLLEEYLRLKNITEKSKTLYRNALTAIFGKTIYFNSVTVEEAVVAFREKLNLYSSWTYNTYLRHLAIFARWANNRYNSRIDIAWIRKEMVAPRKLANHIFTEEETTAILEATQKTDFGDFLALLSYTGCRPYDLLDLAWSDVTLEGSVPQVIWRNRVRGYEEPRPISSAAAAILLRRYQAGADKPMPWQRTNLRNLGRSFDRLLKRLEIPKNDRSLKTFRKTFKHSIRMLPFEHQMYLMRHNSPDVTLNNYTSYSIEEMAVLLEKRSK
jgi:integrase